MNNEIQLKKEILKFTVYVVILASLFAFVYLTNQSSGTDSSLKGLPLDDSYILFQYAKMFAQYGKFYYNPGDLETGATSPLWVMFLSIPYKLGIDLVLASKVMGLTLHILTAVILFAMLLEYTKNRFMSWVGGIFILFSSTLFYLSLSGMDVNLFIFLLACVFYFFTHKKYAETGVVLGLLILARPEGLIVFVFLLLLSIYQLVAYKEKSAQISDLAKIFIIALVLAAPWFYYCFSVTGLPLPVTVYLKSHGFSFQPINLLLLIWPINEFGFSVLALCLLILFERKLFWQKFHQSSFYSFILLPFIYLIPFIFFSSISLFALIGFNAYYGRYVTPILPFTIFFAVIFLAGRANPKSKGVDLKKELSIAAIFIVFIMLFLSNYFLLSTYSSDTFTILNQQVATAKWIDSNLPNNTRIGVDDAGAAIFFSTPSKNHTFIDLVALNSHALIGQDVIESIKKENITYLAIHEKASQELSAEFNLIQIYNVTLTNNSVSQSATEYVYKIVCSK